MRPRSQPRALEDWFGRRRNGAHELRAVDRVARRSHRLHVEAELIARLVRECEEPCTGGTPCANAGEAAHRSHCLQVGAGLGARADDGEVARVRGGKRPCRNPADRRGADGGDLRGVQDGSWPAVLGFEKDDQALVRLETRGPITREDRDHLGAECAGEAARHHGKDAAPVGDVQRAPQRVDRRTTRQVGERVRHQVHATAHWQQVADLCTAQQEELVHAGIMRRIGTAQRAVSCRNAALSQGLAPGGRRGYSSPRIGPEVARRPFRGDTTREIRDPYLPRPRCRVDGRRDLRGARHGCSAAHCSGRLARRPGGDGHLPRPPGQGRWTESAEADQQPVQPRRPGRAHAGRVHQLVGPGMGIRIHHWGLYERPGADLQHRLLRPRRRLRLEQRRDPVLPERAVGDDELRIGLGRAVHHQPIKPAGRSME